MPAVPTPPAVPKPVTPTAPTPPPAIAKPKLNSTERRALNNVLDKAQDWLTSNQAAMIGQTHFRIDQAVAWIQTNAKPVAEKAITGAVAKINALKF